MDYIYIYIYISLLVALVVMEVMVMVVSGVGVLKTRRDGIILWEVVVTVLVKP